MVDTPSCQKGGTEAMWPVLGNVLVALMLSVAAGAGVTLFVIAHQDDSRVGEVLGVLIAVASVSTVAYVVLGQHWF
jgi:hypothetical protein